MLHVSSFTALYDANVLYSAPLRDLLMRLAMTGLYRAKWTETIHDEWSRNLRANRPDVTDAQISRIRRLMNEHVRDALVEGYEALIPALTGLPDPDDRHVLAAAIVGRAHVIVTYNLKDFPPQVLTPYGMEAQHPDTFVRHLIDLNAGTICAAARAQRAALKKPPRTVEEYLEALARQELSQTVAALRELEALL